MSPYTYYFFPLSSQTIKNYLNSNKSVLLHESSSLPVWFEVTAYYIPILEFNP